VTRKTAALHGRERVCWEGAVSLTTDGGSRIADCQAVLSLSGELELRVVDPSGVRFFLGVDCAATKIEIPSVESPIDVFPIRANTNGVVTFRPKSSPIWFGSAKNLHMGRALIVNLARYWTGSPRALRFELSALGWVMQFIAVSDEILMVHPRATDGEYRITHQVEIRRGEDRDFTSVELRELIDDLCLFLSFCHGRWVAAADVAGIGRSGNVLAEQWGSGRASSWDDPEGWLDLHHGDAICELYEPFCEKLRDASWKDALRNVVYWFVRADTNLVGPDGACILLQATLERFAWQLLVRDRAAISQTGFEKLAAADKLRLLLDRLSIPATIPLGLAGLREFAANRGLDGPEAFTFVRNRIVHPPKSASTRERLPYYEAYSLAKWYVEMAVLSACGYDGEYSNRTLPRRWVGQVERVPWAS